MLWDGTVQPKITLVEEAPGKDEDIKGRSLAGKVGQLLDQALRGWLPPSGHTPTRRAYDRPFVGKSTH